MGILHTVTGNLKQIKDKTITKKYGDFICENEKVHYAFSLVRDLVIITDKRIIEIDLQGVTGTKKSLTSIFAKNIVNVTIETAGVGIDDSEMIIYHKTHNASKDILEKHYEFNKNFKIDSLYKHLINFIIDNQNTKIK